MISIDSCEYGIFSVSGTLPSGQLSAIPWRRSSVRYTNNEAYFDVVEEVDASKWNQTILWNLHISSQELQMGCHFWWLNGRNIDFNEKFHRFLTVIDKSGQTVFAEIQGYVRHASYSLIYHARKKTHPFLLNIHTD